MLIRDIVRGKDLSGSSETTGLVTLPADATSIEAVEALADNNIGIILVCTDEGELAGVLSERDVIRSIKRTGHAALDSKVGDAMTKSVSTCRSTDPAFEIIEMMNRGGFRHMPIVDGGKIVGLVSSRDIFRYMTVHANSEEKELFWEKFYWK